MTLRVLHVISGLDVGGAEMTLYRLVSRHSDEFGAEHIIVSLTKEGPVGQRLLNSGFEVIALDLKGFSNLFLVLIKLIRLIHRKKPDIVQTWMYHGDLIGGLASRIAGIKNIIWGVRTTDISHESNRSLKLIRKACAVFSSWLPASIVCAAEESLSYHLNIGYSKKKMLVIPNGFDLNFLHATNNERDVFRSNLGVSASQFVIGSIGRYSPVKNYTGFIHAVNLLLSNHSNLKILLVGKGLEKSNLELMELIHKSSSPNSFILLGSREDIPVCLKSMDLFCLPSLTEGFPNALGEAMAMGLPCISTPVGDAPLLLGGTGVISNSTTAESIASSIEMMFLLRSEELKEKGRLAKQRIKNHFSIESTVKKYNQLYSEILN
jgi:glycosyltransferase involved in cell wall biosynthesis